MEDTRPHLLGPHSRCHADRVEPGPLPARGFTAHHCAPLRSRETMTFKLMKVSACGHELGSDMLFTTRIGFSGTPSNLLPIDLGECKYEPGSQGQILAVLTDQMVVSTVDVPKAWKALSLLEIVAAAEPPFHARHGSSCHGN